MKYRINIVIERLDEDGEWVAYTARDTGVEYEEVEPAIADALRARQAVAA